MTKAEAAIHRSALARARQFRNGLMVAMLGIIHSVRKISQRLSSDLLSNVSSVRGGSSCPLRDQRKRADERILDPRLIPWIDRYLEVHRPVLAQRVEESNALWLSSNN